MKRILFIVLLSIVTIGSATAQDNLKQLIEQAESMIAKNKTNFQTHQDSLLLQELKLEVERLKLKELIRQSKLVQNSQRADSFVPTEQMNQIDSLRLSTKGTPLIIEKDTLLTLYASIGGISVQDRIDYARKRILGLGKAITAEPDSVYLFESEHATDIMSRGQVILTVTNSDALWHNVDRQTLAHEYLSVIDHKITELHQEYGLSSKLQGVLLTIVVLIVQSILIFLTNRVFRRFKYNVYKKRHQLHPWKIKNYEFLNTYKQVRVSIFLIRCARLAVVALQFVITVPIVFYIFPETKELAYTMLGYLWTPIRDIIDFVIGYMPKLLKIIIIYICFRYINKVLKYFTKEIATGNLHIHGFYDDWAFPTYYIVRVLLYSFMLVMIWPLLPNSESPIFQGVSVFVGLVVSLGSTTVIGNIMAGMVLTYMRSFKVGDEIKLNDGVSGTVIEKTPFVTRIHTVKNKVVTIPNSAVMGAYTINYTISARDEGVIIYSNISASYEVDRHRVEELLVAAALETEGVITEQSPYVLITKLDDFYCYYQINAYTKKINNIGRVYSSLHANIIDQFHEAGIEILAPHYFAQRDGSDVVMPPKYMK